MILIIQHVVNCIKFVMDSYAQISHVYIVVIPNISFSLFLNDDELTQWMPILSN